MSLVTIPSGVAIKGNLYPFYSQKDSTFATLTISKKESDELVYLLGVEYLGIDSKQPLWKISLSKDNEPPKTFTFWNSNSFSFKVADKNCIRIHEIDTYKEYVYYADLTTPKYLFRLHIPLEIRQLIGIAHSLPHDNFDIFYHDKIVVIDFQSKKFEILVAQPGDTKFEKCSLEEAFEYDPDWQLYDFAYTVSFKGRECSFIVSFPPKRESFFLWEEKQLRLLE